MVAAGGLVPVPFRVGPLWFERTIYQNAVDFMIDTRHYTGNDRNTCRGSFGWRDDHHFAWVLHTLVPQCISTLRAPLNFDCAKAESGAVVVDFGNGGSSRVTVTETGASTGIFTGRVDIRPGAPIIRASHGFGYLGTHATLQP